MTYAHHPIANIFPLLQTGELAELSDDIKQNGLKQPIYLYEGKILDGRNRFAACQSAGVEPKFEQYTGDSPTSFVISLNLKRRHLTTSQAAAVAVDALPFFESEARKRQEAGNNQHRVTQKVAEGSKGEAREKVAAVLHTNRQYVSDAKAIKAKAPERFEQIRTGEKTIREVKREMRREDQEVKIKAAQDAPKPKVVKGPFDVILADPPWRYEHCEADNREIENQYPTATLEDIFKHSPNAKDDSILFLWATAPKLDEALQVMKAWGFSYRSCAVWDKQKIGMGYWWRIQHELLLVGVKGSPGATPECERVSSMFSESRGAHSKKPECVYAWIDRAFPSAVKLEMYQREVRLGWAGWGNEV
jgi:N6-adenosine-specific RNA methylase IME4